jgi:hypothetical protein
LRWLKGLALMHFNKVLSITALGVLFISQATSTRADDNKEAADAAYCVGVISRSIEYLKGVDVSADEQKKFWKQNLVEDATKEGKIDSITVSKLISAGYADANLCLEKRTKCFLEAAKRKEDKVDPRLSGEQLNDCKQSAELICSPTYKCSND